MIPLTPPFSHHRHQVCGIPISPYFAQCVTCLPGMMIVTDKDVGFLMGYLCQHSSEWGDIGTALHFLPGELKNIRHNHQEVQQCLKEVFCQWVQWPTTAHPQTPTIEMLRDALRSDLVGLGAVANKLYDARNYLPSRLDF